MTIILLPLLAFAASVAMLVIKKNAFEWRIAAIINATPIFLAVLALFLGLGR